MRTQAPPHGAARAPHDHLVTFYESDGFLVDSIVGFLAPALEAGDPAIAVATGRHLEAVEAAVAGLGLGGRLTTLDAGTTLDRLTVDGVPDRGGFTEMIGDLLDGAPPGTRIFGEMVSLLWDRGDIGGAIALEDLWNELAATRPFTLLCAYPMRSFEEEGDGFRAVCEAHSSVVPSESYSMLEDADARRRVVASLQQEAAAGAHERRELRRKQAELEDALDRLRELDRLRREFVAMVAHDIRSPAGIVAGYLDLVQDHWADLGSETARTMLLAASENIVRIERLVDDILTMAQIDAGEFTFETRPVDLGRIVERTAEQVGDRTGRDIVVTRPPGLRAALADEDRQVQILSNLLSNAVKFSPDDTTVHITVEDDDDRLIVRVRDEGDGIPPDDQRGLFRPFSRLAPHDPRVAGTGLGLYIAKALVEGQGGTIWVDSAPGAGSTFSYTVPATPTT